MNNMNKAWTVAKVNFRYTMWIAYLVTAICVLSSFSNYIIAKCIDEENTIISAGSYMYMLCILAPVFIASINYSKLMHIGVKKRTYLQGAVINYVVFAAIVSVANVLAFYFLDKPMDSAVTPVYNLIEVFGWDSDLFTAFFCQFAFLFLAQIVFHTLTFMQTKWYGIAADVLIIALISVFTPIVVLRQAEAFFFYMIIFIKPAIVQIGICLGLALIVLFTNRFYLKRRTS